MKRLHVSLVALALIFASFAAPAFANGTATGRNVAVSLADLPDIVAPGDHVTGTVTIALSGDVREKRHRAKVQLFITTPLGDAPVQTASFNIQPGTQRTFNIDTIVPQNTPTGVFSLKLVVTLDGETLSVDHELKVGK
jgi:hypothetical protein